MQSQVIPTDAANRRKEVAARVGHGHGRAHGIDHTVYLELQSRDMRSLKRPHATTKPVWPPNPQRRGVPGRAASMPAHAAARLLAGAGAPARGGLLLRATYAFTRRGSSVASSSDPAVTKTGAPRPLYRYGCSNSEHGSWQPVPSSTPVRCSRSKAKDRA